MVIYQRVMMLPGPDVDDPWRLEPLPSEAASAFALSHAGDCLGPQVAAAR